MCSRETSLLALLFLLSCGAPSTPQKKSPPPKKTPQSTAVKQAQPPDSWKLAKNIPQVDLLGVAFVGDHEASAVGDILAGNGPILHTLDAGASWVVGTTTTEILTDVSFDGKRGVAVGYAGQISITEDGARSWSTARRDEESLLRGVARRKDLLVAVGEGTLLTSKDAGKTFEAATLSQPFALEDVALWSDQDSVAVGSDGSLLRTKDLWKTYEAEPTFSKEPLFGVARGEGFYCAVGGHGTILCQRDSGAKEAPPSKASVDLFDVAFEGNLGVAVGAKGLITLTMDGGASWRVEDSKTTQDLYAVALHNGRAIVVGSLGTILVRSLSLPSKE